MVCAVKIHFICGVVKYPTLIESVISHAVNAERGLTQFMENELGFPKLKY